MRPCKTARTPLRCARIEGGDWVADNAINGAGRGSQAPSPRLPRLSSAPLCAQLAAGQSALYFWSR
jgi:hypothetical protein